MTPPAILIEGQTLRLGERIGKGGEGEVYSIADGTGRAVKYYTCKDISERESKICAMVGCKIALKSNLVAFPLAVARHRDGKFAGFVMNMISGHKPLFELYSPGARKQNFPRADFRFLVRTCTNIARAIASVHSAGCVIGDINHSGILVSQSAIAALIDADSFQFTSDSKQFRCRVGVPEYTPPELQGRRLDNITRTVNHDAFGLAVILFQMLFMGRHPFVGAFAKGEMPIPKAISELRFVYSKKRNVGMTPPPGAARLEDFPPVIIDAFEAAFGNDGSSSRPSPEHWVTCLEALERSLSRCSVNDLHYYPSTAPECIWCRMERQLGIVLFLQDYTQSRDNSAGVDPGESRFDLVQVWARIDAIALPTASGTSPSLPIVTCSPSAEGVELKRNERNVRLRGWCIAVVGTMLVFGFPALLLIWLGIVLYGVSKASAKIDSSSELKQRYDECHRRWITAVAAWRRNSGIEEMQKLKRSLVDAKRSYEALGQEEADLIAAYQISRRERHLNQFLDGYPIRNSKIHGIGPARMATLASYGIETAADVSEGKLLLVPGFGPTNSVPLLEWRSRIASRFTYNDSPTAADQAEVRKIKSEIAAKASSLRRTLISGCADLSAASERIQKSLKIPDPALSRLHRERRQLEADLNYLGENVPALPFSSGHIASVGPPNRSGSTLSTADVYKRFGAKYAQRGDTYQRTGRVTTAGFDARTSVASGTVRGRSSRAPYRVTIQLNTTCDTIQTCQCTCPMGGHCKHSAAVLLDLLRKNSLP